MVKYLIGIVGALLGSLAGAWLMVAPFALAFQPEGADWINATHVDFWTGLALVIVSVIGLVTYALGLVETLRERGVIAPKDQQSTQASAQANQASGAANNGSTAQGTGSAQDQLTPLIAEMLREMQQERRNSNEKTDSEEGRVIR